MIILDEHPAPIPLTILLADDRDALDYAAEAEWARQHREIPFEVEGAA